MLLPVRALALAALLGLAACSSTGKPADAPENAASASASPDAPPAPAASADPAPTATPVPMGTARKPPGASEYVIDDYSLTERDCDNLGKQYGDVAKADQMAALSPKLSAKQRAQTEANIDKVIGKMSEQWIENCQKSLVGKNVDPKGIKCALASKTVKAFDVCLNGEDKPKK